MSRLARDRRITALAVLFVLGSIGAIELGAQAPTRHEVTGMVIEVLPSRERFVVSHDAVPGAMAAMTMPFDVRDAKALDGIGPGMRVTFTLVLSDESAHAEAIRVLRYESAEQDPFTARRLTVLTDLMGGPATSTLAVGQPVPNFTLIDQKNRPVTLSELRGRVVAINFIYTSCALPQFCFRVANQFGVLQRRFTSELPTDLVLLTVTFDPARDQPEVLANYARQSLRADPEAWRFLTGTPADVRRVCELFGVEFFQDEGLMNHSSRTAVIDREGKLVANIEGNEFTARQLGDLVDTVLRRPTTK